MVNPTDSHVPPVHLGPPVSAELPVDSLLGDAALPLTSTIGTISKKGKYTISFDGDSVKFDIPKVTVKQIGSPPSFASDESRVKLGAEFSKSVKEAAKKTHTELTWDWDEYKTKMESPGKDVEGVSHKKTKHTEEWFVMRMDVDGKAQKFKIAFEIGKGPLFFHNDVNITDDVLKDLGSNIPKDEAELEKFDTKRALQKTFEQWIDGRYSKFQKSTQPLESDLAAEKAALEAKQREELAKTLPPTRVVSKSIDTDKADQLTAPNSINSLFGPSLVEKAAPTSRLAKVSALSRLGRGLALAFGTLLTAIGGALAVTFTAVVVACKAIGQAIGATFGSIADAIAKKGDHKWRDKLGQAFSKPLGAIGTLSVAIPLSVALGISELGNALLEKSGSGKAAESMKRFRKLVMDFTVTAVAESKYATDIPKVYEEYKERKPKAT